MVVVHHGRLCEPGGLKLCDTLLHKSFRDGEQPSRWYVGSKRGGDWSFSFLATAEHGGGSEGWKDIRSSVLIYADEFPCLEEIGWNIALTKKGIQAIDLNLGFGLVHLLVTCGGMRRKLNLNPVHTIMNLKKYSIDEFEKVSN